MPDKRYSRSAAERAAELFDLPGEAAAGLPRVTITGCRRVQIEHHCGIAEYGRERICVRCGRMTVRVSGSGLELRAMNREELLITGAVSAVEYGA